MWARSILSFIAAASLLSPIVSAESVTGPRLLVIDENNAKEDYSVFLEGLKAQGFDVSIKAPKSAGALFVRDKRIYDHVVLLPGTSSSYGPALKAQDLLKFVNADGNILALLSTDSVTEDLQDLAKEIDIDIPGKNYGVVDHVNFDRISAAETHDVVVVPAPAVNPARENYFSVSGPIAFSGTGVSLGASPLVNSILSAPRTAYCYDTKEDNVYADSPSNVGKQLALVAALQGRNNARLTFVGSAKAFSDEYFKKEVQGSDGKKVKVANKEFANKVAQWTFKVTGVLRVDSIQHSLVNSSDFNPPQYRVKNDITYTVSISEHTTSGWIPFKVPSADNLQVEFTMLDPYYRINLKSTVAGTYTTSFTAPDQHGIFAFRLNYKRPYLTYVDEKISVVVRHFAHDEYTRSWAISGSWVWIAGIAVTVVGWGMFVAVWLFTADPSRTDQKKKI